MDPVRTTPASVPSFPSVRPSLLRRALRAAWVGLLLCGVVGGYGSAAVRAMHGRASHHACGGQPSP